MVAPLMMSQDDYGTIENSLQAHSIQFYDFIPSQFTCLSRSFSGLIAAGRENGSLDVFDEKRDFFMICHIPAAFIGSVEAVAWFKERLFCAGATGILFEIDVYSSMVKNSSVVFSSSVVRSLTIIENKVIVGNDGGYIVVFTLDPTLSHAYTLPKFDGKILCTTFCSARKPCLAVSTSKGSLNTWMEEDVFRHQYDLLSGSDKCVIWSLTFACNFLFSGDSKGNVSVWDIAVGGLLYSFPSHLGDVLAMTTSPDEKTVFSGGSDALIRKYQLSTSEDGDNRWELSGVIRGCRRDIRGLAFLPGEHFDPSSVDGADSRCTPHRLLACGLDARLQLLACDQADTGDHRQRSATHRAFPAQVGRTENGRMQTMAALPYWPASICCPPPIRLSTGDNDTSCLALLHYPSRLCLVRLGPANSLNMMKACQWDCDRYQSVSVLHGPLQLAEIRPRRGAEMISSALSICGRYVAYSDNQRTRILEVSISLTGKRQTSKPLVNITRLPWLSATAAKTKRDKRRRRRTSHSGDDHSSSAVTSSSETNTDTDDVAMTEDTSLSPAKLAAFFSVTTKDGDAEAKTNPFVVAAASRYVGASITASPLAKPSSCLVFTPDSKHVILVQTRQPKNRDVIGTPHSRVHSYLVCICLKSGAEVWRTNLSHNAEGERTIHAHTLSISPKPMESIGYIIALGCSDARVRIYGSVSGHHVFTCPCLDSPTGHHPLPVSIDFRPWSEEEQPLQTHLSILYTNNQLTAWSMTLDDTPADDHVSSHHQQQAAAAAPSVSVELNYWLTMFWHQMGEEVRSSLGVFHSQAWLSSDTWLLASDQYIVLLTMDQPYSPGIIKEMLKAKRFDERHDCLRVLKNFGSTIQVVRVSQLEMAVVTINSAALTLKLPAPMQRKAFGT